MILAVSSPTPTQLNSFVLHGLIICISVTYYSNERISPLLMTDRIYYVN